MLVGGGHSHVQVVKRLGMQSIPGVRVTLISEQPLAAYSGMLPGCIAGQYTESDMHIQLLPLCAMSGVRFIQGSVCGLDLQQHTIRFFDRPPLHFDVLSLNCGAQPLVLPQQGIAVKPISDFLPAWRAALAAMQCDPDIASTISVVGAGAGGVELAFACRTALPERVSITLYGPQLLGDHCEAARRQVRRALVERGIEYVQERFSLTRAEDGHPVFWVTDVKAPAWVAESGLEVDELGFVRVDEQLRSVSHSQVFAAGDVAHLSGQQRPKAGVYAVRAGKVLATNLAYAAQELAMVGRKHRYRAQRGHLNLINCADGTAIASRGRWAFRGRLWWRLKDSIDRAFIARFNDLPEMPKPTMSVSDALQAELPDESMRCGGCGAKVAAEPLRRVLARLPTQDAAYVSLGIGDDAAQITNQGTQTLLTVDGFRAMLDDPYLFGRITAHHSLNDIFAMAAQPTAALAFVTLPLMAANMMEEELFQVLSGAVSVLNEASVPLVGGHSAEGAELSLALTVLGSADAQTLTKGGAQPGDALILTKALGTGILLAAAMRGESDANGFSTCLASMDQSNARAVAILQRCQVNALTDVTGFGVLGHLGEILRASDLGGCVRVASVPVLPGTAAAMAAGVRSSLHGANEQALADYAIAQSLVTDARLGVLVDPQTSGGLLACVPAARADECVQALQQAGYAEAAIIGRTMPSGTLEITE
ncbi:MAG TPA: selenide, water dikinase SelD [Gammaproteobacteria bacterium]|nr:selenide, water dikinase SelD [Gammaproteobacteria bacterium]